MDWDPHNGLQDKAEGLQDDYQDRNTEKKYISASQSYVYSSKVHYSNKMWITLNILIELITSGT